VSGQDKSQAFNVIGSSNEISNVSHGYTNKSPFRAQLSEESSSKGFTGAITQNARAFTGMDDELRAFAPGGMKRTGFSNITPAR